MVSRAVFHWARRLLRFWPALWVVLPVAVGLVAPAVVRGTAARPTQASSGHVYLPLVAQGAGAASPDGLWRDVDEASLAPLQSQRQIIPHAYRTVMLDQSRFQRVRSSAPMEGVAGAASAPVKISLPLPDGRFQWFGLVESSIMDPGLAAKFPEIKTYAGQGIDDPAASIRLDWTPRGFHGMILSPEGAVFIDPYSRADTIHYISYYASEALPKVPFAESEPEDTATAPAPARRQPLPQAASGSQLRTYRLAVAATGEYTTFQGGTVALAQAAIVTSINRVDGIYEREVAVRLTLVANNNQLIATNASTDAYTNGNVGLMLGENQTNIDGVIGSGNYDIGHVFGTNSGGRASLGCVCANGSKARGATGSAAPTGDPFDVDYVAHEMGHQFGAEHTWNGNQNSCTAGQLSTSTAYEPGSGSTIMGYAGICGSDDLQSNSDAYFHGISIDQIVAFTTSGGGNACGTGAGSGNGIPTANAGPDYTIPVRTPFTLTGSGSDPNGDALTYDWEEFDLGAAGPPNNPNSPPYFRSFSPVASPSRTLPKIADIVNNTTSKGEILPNVGGTLNFRLTVRDNRIGGGGVNDDSMQVNVAASAGPFLVTSPNTPLTWKVGESQTVTWNVANTTAAPVSCPAVNILLSTDGGYTYPITLASGVPNNGSATVIVPNVPGAAARIKVACASNIFFDISNANFTIKPSANAGGPYTTAEGSNVTLDASASSASDLYEWDFDNDGLFGDGFGANPSFDLVGQDGVYPVAVRVTKNGISDTASSTVTVTNVAPALSLNSSPTPEGSPAAVGGVASDPGWLDALAATIDWGDGWPIEPIAGTLENIRPDATLTFNATHTYGDDGNYNAQVCASDDDTTTCQVIVVQIVNVPPAVSIAPGQVMRINEGDWLSIRATFSDPGWQDTYTALLDWGTGETEPGALKMTAEGPPLDQGEVTGRHEYGDNGSFTVTARVADDDGGEGAAAFQLTVDNVAPTADIDESAATQVNGTPTFIARIGKPLTFRARSRDPGSDDLLLSWDWDDGAPAPDVATTYLVNPPNSDPFPSPSVQPRDVTDSQRHAFAQACAYTIGFSAADDDGGKRADQANVVITGNAGRTRSSGYWQHQYGGQGQIDFDRRTLECYLKIVGHMSRVFDEARDASTIAKAHDVLFMQQNGGSAREQFDRELLTVWLNFANGAITYDGTFADLVARAEAVRLDPNASEAQLREQKNILHHING